MGRPEEARPPWVFLFICPITEPAYVCYCQRRLMVLICLMRDRARGTGLDFRAGEGRIRVCAALCIMPSYARGLRMRHGPSLVGSVPLLSSARPSAPHSAAPPATATSKPSAAPVESATRPSRNGCEVEEGEKEGGGRGVVIVVVNGWVLSEDEGFHVPPR